MGATGSEAYATEGWREFHSSKIEGGIGHHGDDFRNFACSLGLVWSGWARGKAFARGLRWGDMLHRS